eukprot:TRINITY_DN4156_c0_g2_i2.p1 TRINITY_DN4156_c0_g2~~TRINITY_DN4156_c0_g2_i2.p1  ORF type:complete len:240 (+),score=81.04 TRINITY_DN4156_c0_g2_i2:25-720(+)
MADKKKKAAPKLSEKDAEKLLLEYMQRQNRPYNNKTVFENLHGEIGQVQVTKVLAELADKGALQCKENGKQKIYWVTQQESSEDHAMSATDFEQQLSNMTADVAVLKEKVDALDKENKSLASSPVTSEATTKKEALLAEKENLAEKLEQLSSSSVVITKADREAAQKQFDHARDAWRKRKRMCREIMETICSFGGQKTKDFVETVGIETDEDAHVSLEAGESVRMLKKVKR